MSITAAEAWEKLLEKYNIVDEINRHGIFHIKARLKSLKNLVSCQNGTVQNNFQNR